MGLLQVPNFLSPLCSANVDMLPYRVVEVIPFQFYFILSLLTRDEHLGMDK